MKYLIIPIIALGLCLSMTYGIEYNCAGTEMFPTYYGSPFVFKQESLGSSMEYFYSISGIVLNVIVWSIPLYILHYWISKWIAKAAYKKVINVIYKMIIGILLLFTLLTVALSYGMMGSGFSKDLNYWYWNLDKEAKDWEVNCEGQWKFGL